MLVRVAELLPLSNEWSVKQFNVIVSPLSHLRGLASALINSFDEKKCSKRTLEELKTQVLPPLLLLGKKLDSCFRKSIFPYEGEKGNIVKVNEFYMNQLLTLADNPTSLPELEDSNKNAKNDLNSQNYERLYRSSLHFGKVEVILSYLTMMKNGLIPNDLQSGVNLHVCENLVFFDLPICLSLINGFSFDSKLRTVVLLKNVISCISGYLFKCEYLTFIEDQIEHDFLYKLSVKSH